MLDTDRALFIEALESLSEWAASLGGSRIGTQDSKILSTYKEVGKDIERVLYPGEPSPYTVPERKGYTVRSTVTLPSISGTMLAEAIEKTLQGLRGYTP